MIVHSIGPCLRQALRKLLLNDYMEKIESKYLSDLKSSFPQYKESIIRKGQTSDFLILLPKQQILLIPPLKHCQNPLACFNFHELCFDSTFNGNVSNNLNHCNRSYLFTLDKFFLILSILMLFPILNSKYIFH